MSLKKLEKDLDLVPKNLAEAFSKRKLEIFEKEFIKCKKLNPENKSVYMYKGIILEEQKQYEEAIKCFEIFFEQYPDFFPALKFKGSCYLSLEKYESARELCKEYLRFQIDDVEAWCYVIVSFYMEGKREVAMGLLDYALLEVTNTSGLSLLKGMLYEKQDMKSDALMSYINSQILSKNDEDKGVAGEKIFNLFK